MPKIELNLSEAVSLTPVPEGTYSVEVQEVEGPKEGQNSHYMTAILIINDGGDHDGRKFFYNFPITGKGAGIGARFVSLCTGEDVDEEEDIVSFDTDDLIGAELRAVVDHREWPKGSGEMRDNVDKVLPAE